MIKNTDINGTKSRITPGQAVTFKANDAYFRGKPKLTKITYRFLTNNAARDLAFVAGEVDAATGLADQRWLQRTLANPGVVVDSFDPAELTTLSVNVTKPPFDNIKVRQALAHSIDAAKIAQYRGPRFTRAGKSAIPANNLGFDENAGVLPPDPAKAKKLLAEAGFPNGIDLTCGSYTDQDSVRRSEIVGEQLRKAGIRLKYTTGTIPEISGQFFGNEKKFDMLLSAWTGRPDPSMTYSLMYSKDAYFNAGRVDHGQKLTDLLAESRVAERIEGRKLIFWQLQRIVMEQALVAPLAFQYELVAASQKVKGYKANLLGKPKYEFISLQG